MPDRIKRQAEKNLFGKRVMVKVKVRRTRLPSPHRQHEKSGDY
jgi:hypothetical protein